MRVLASLLLFLIFLMTNTYSQVDIRDYFDQHGNNFKIELNGLSGSAHRVHGIKLNLSKLGFKGKIKYDDISLVSMKLCQEYKGILKVSYENLDAVSIEFDSEMWFISYKQKYNGLTVYNSELGYSIDKNNNIVSLGSDCYENINVSTNPNISTAQASQIAHNDSKIHGGKNEEKSELIVYPSDNLGSTKFSLCWLLELNERDKGISFRYIIDANTGEIIEKFDNYRESWVSGKVTGGYWPKNQNDTPIYAGFHTNPVKLFSISMNLEATAATNDNGEYYMSGFGFGVKYITFPLLDNYSQIFDGEGTGTPFQETRKITPETTVDKQWEVSDASNLKWHMRKCHDYFKNNYSFSSLDYIMEGHVNSGSSTNGKADGTNIFFGNQNNFYWARNSDVIYHEYTHNAIFKIYNGWIGSSGQAIAMDEGLADYFGCSISDDQYMAENCGVDRNLVNSYTYDPNVGKYTNGLVIGGACWNVRIALGSVITDNLVFKALQISPKARNFQDFLYNMLVANQNYYNSAYTSQILSAFAEHAIYPVPLSATMSGPSMLNSGEYGTWTVTTTGGVVPYTYSWSYYVYCDGQNGLYTNESLVPNSVPCGYWYTLGNTTNSVTRYDSRSFDLKCTVKDATNATYTITKHVDINNALMKASEQDTATIDLDSKYNYTESLNNFPNPWNPSTKIFFQISTKSHVTLRIFDILGREVASLVNRELQPGKYEHEFNANDLPSGIYICVLTTAQNTLVNKMLLIK